MISTYTLHTTLYIFNKHSFSCRRSRRQTMRSIVTSIDKLYIVTSRQVLPIHNITYVGRVFNDNAIIDRTHI